MKHLDTYINEFLVKGHTISKKYLPETKKELKEIIDEKIDAEGPDCDLNDIDTSKITDMYGLFASTGFCGDISSWDVSNVEDMDRMFFDCTHFNCDISSWDTSNLKSASHMFEHCHIFNQDLSSWNISSVKTMAYMFADCYKFNQNLSSWDITKCHDFEGMFWACYKLNQNFESWDTSGSTIDDMFRDCPALKNKPSWYLE